MLPYLEYTTTHDILLPTVGSSSSSMGMLPNMIMSIVTYVSPLHQAYLRSAGLKGLLIFNQLAEDGAVPLCVEATDIKTMVSKKKVSPHQVDTHCTEDYYCPQLIPFAIPRCFVETPKWEVINTIFRFSTVVISHSAMVARRGSASATSPLDILLGYDVELVRYHLDASVKEVGSYDPEEPDHALAIFGDKMFNIKEVQLTGCESVTTIHHSFLACLSTTTRVDTSLLQHVTSIGNYFMCRYEAVEEKGIDLTSLGTVTSIGDFFLEGCSAKTIDISTMKRLLHVGTGFLSGCNNLRQICTAPLANLQLIPADFLLGCKSLTSIDTTPFRNVTAIGDSFLANCPLFTTIDLKPFENVTTIGVKFLYRCSGLKSIDVSLLKSVTGVGRDFLKGCASTVVGGVLTGDHLPLSLRNALQQWKHENVAVAAASTSGPKGDNSSSSDDEDFVGLFIDSDNEASSSSSVDNNLFTSDDDEGSISLSADSQ